MRNKYRIITMYRLLITYHLLPWIGCGNLIPDLQVEFASNTNVISRNSSAILNCTVTIHKISNSTLIGVKVKLITGATVLRKVESQLYLSHESEFLSYKVKHRKYLQAQSFFCEAECSITGKVFKKIEVVYENPPLLPPVFVSTMQHGNLYVFGTVGSTELVYEKLKTKYFLEAEGKCNYKASIEPCGIVASFYRHSIIKCTINNAACKFYDVRLTGSNRIATRQTKTLSTQDIDASKISVNMECVYRSSTKITLHLNHNIVKISSEETRFIVRYKKTGLESSIKYLYSYGNTFSLKLLKPFECYEVSARLFTKVFPDLIVNLDWSDWQKHCTSPKVFVASPKQFTCRENSVSSHGSPSVVKLTWQWPDISREYGILTSYMLGIDFGEKEKISNVNMSIASVNEVLIQRNEFYFVRDVTFWLTACNSCGCSLSGSLCHLKFYGHRLDSSVSPFWRVMSYLVPIVIMCTLILAACISYYRKQSITEDSQEALSTTRSDHQLQRTTIPTPRISSGLQKQENIPVEENHHNKNKFVDANVAAFSTENMNSLLVNVSQ